MEVKLVRKWLKELRQESELTQEQLAKELSISRPYYTEIENGCKTPSVQVAKQISKVLKFEWTLFLKIDVSI